MNDNQTFFDGGGVYAAGAASLTIRGSTLSGNEAGISQGGVASARNTLISDSSITANTTLSGFDAAIGVPSSLCGTAATLTIERSTISENMSEFPGSIRTCGVVRIISSTISGNRSAEFFGGGIFARDDTLEIVNSTIVGNSSLEAGAGLHSSDAVVTLRNTLFGAHALATCAVSGTGSITSLGSTIDTDLSCRGFAPGDAFFPGVGLEPLADNGGPTLTHALLPGSPAIDAADPLGAPATDQRGFLPPGLPDVGAFESAQSTDADVHGFANPAAGGEDCDGADPLVFPGAEETPYDGVDQNCDGSVLDDVDGDGVVADQAVGGGPDCDDGDATIFPGAADTPSDGIDQDCDGVDASPQTVEVRLVGGWNALVYGGADGVDPAEFAALIGLRLESLWGYEAGSQAWLVHRLGGLALLNTLGPLQAGQARFLLSRPGPAATVELPDLPAVGRVVVDLPPQWSFVGFTGGGEGPPVLALLPTGAQAAFRYASGEQAWEGVFPGRPVFLQAFTTVGRLTALFVFNGTTEILAMGWEQVGAGGP